MNTSTLFIIICLIVITFIILIFTITKAVSISHSITYGNTKLFTSNLPIATTSDATNTILYGTPKGIILYDIDTEEKKIINPLVVIGLAYDSQNDLFLTLASDGTISSLNRNGELTFIQNGGISLYDLVDGYYIKTNKEEIYATSNNDKTPANGNYGLIQIKIT